MDKVFVFIKSLKKSFLDLFGFPTIKVYSDLVEVYFETNSTIRDLSCFDAYIYDEFRIFPKDGLICIVFTFYL